MEPGLSGQSGEIFYSIAAAFSCGAYILRNILWLRILLVIAAIVYIVSGMILGITSMIGWNSAYLAINLYHVVILLLDRVTINLPEETRQVYQRYFSSISTREFKKLVTLHEFQWVRDEVIVREGENPRKLFILLRGEVEILKAGVPIASLAEGDFIGEMSFLSEDPASASAHARGEVLYAYWTQDDMHRLKHKNISLYERFSAILGRDLVRKLKNRNDQQAQNNTGLDYVV